MVSMIGAGLFTIIAVMTLLVTAGAPLGEFTMGGKHRILPPKMRIAGFFSLLIQILAILVILQVGGIGFFGLPATFAKGFCFFFAAYLSLNTVMNFLSRSKKEKYVMTPLSLVTAICFWLTAFGH